MKKFLIYFGCMAMLAGILWSCETWELPMRKSQRDCKPPSGILNVKMDLLRAEFSIAENSGTIDKVEWSFGDKSTSTTVTTGLSTTYTYPETNPPSNTYTIKATLTNTCGDIKVLQQDIVVTSAVLPTVALEPVTNFFNTSAIPVIKVTSTGNAPITRYGVYYSTNNLTPNVGDSNLELAGPVTADTSIPLAMTNLQENTQYYVRAYAYNAYKGPGFSQVQTFRTGFNPVVLIDGPIATGISTAVVNFRVNSLGSPVAESYGIVYSLDQPNPVHGNAPNFKVEKPQIGINLITLKDLIPNTKYYYRLFTKQPNNKDFVYGNVGTFTTAVDPVAQDLVASVAFTDQSLQDVSGFGNHVKLVGNPVFVADHTGRPSSAIQLDGVDDYFYMPENTNSSLNPDALSVSIWIKPAPLTGANRMQIYNKSNFEDSNNEVYSSLLKRENDVGPGLTILTDIKQNSNCVPGKGWESFPVTTSIEMDVWHHLVFTYSGNVARMYLDGALLSSKNDLPSDRIDKCPGGELRFGAAPKIVSWYFKGAMDDIRIYKRALTPAEVQTLRNQ
ncbi:LamG-like jellyroll fold domain-containing protein [Spirosoma flavus]